MALGLGLLAGYLGGVASNHFTCARSTLFAVPWCCLLASRSVGGWERPRYGQPEFAALTVGLVPTVPSWVRTPRRSRSIRSRLRWRPPRAWAPSADCLVGAATCCPRPPPLLRPTHSTPWWADDRASAVLSFRAWDVASPHVRTGGVIVGTAARAYRAAHVDTIPGNRHLVRLARVPCRRRRLREASPSLAAVDPRGEPK